MHAELFSAAGHIVISQLVLDLVRLAVILVTVLYCCRTGRVIVYCDVVKTRFNFSDEIIILNLESCDQQNRSYCDQKIDTGSGSCLTVILAPVSYCCTTGRTVINRTGRIVVSRTGRMLSAERVVL